MKKFIFTVFTIALAVTACKESKEYTLTGHIPTDRYDGKTAYLYENPRHRGISPIDSAVVENGTFTFRGIEGDTLAMRFVELDRRGGIYPYVIEKGDIKMNIDTAGWNWKVEGSTINTSYNELNDSINSYFKTGWELSRHNQELKERGDLTPQQEEQWKAQSEKMKSDIEKYVSSFIEKYADNQLGEYVYQTAHFLSPEKQLELYSKMRDSYQQNERNMRTKTSWENLLATAEGTPYRDISGLDLSGNPVSLSHYVGKGNVVFIDFWASWCGPCRQVMPEVKAVYDEYKNKGLTIVGVSLDADKAAWEKATKDDGIEWPELSNFKGWDDEAAVVYGVRFIPQMILINKEGIIVDRNFAVDELTYKLEELF